jgi:PAS domain S-box-containing protein
MAGNGARSPREPMPSLDDGVLEALWQLPELGLAVVDRQLRFVRVNDTFAALNNLSAEAHLGRPIREVVPGGAAPASSNVQAVLGGGGPVDLVVEVGTDGAPGGVRRWSERYVPVFADRRTSTPWGVVVIRRELGDAEVLRAQLDQRSDQLRLAVEASGLGVWDWDAASGLVRWSPEMEHLMGMAPGRFDGTFDGYLAVVHPDDRAAVLATIRRSVELGQPHHIEHRTDVDGQTRWIEGRGAVVRDALGAPVGLRGVALDITVRKRAEERLRQEKAVFESVADVSRAVGANQDRAAVARAVADTARRHCDAVWIAVLVDDGAEWVVAAGAGPVDEHTAALAASAARATPAAVVQLGADAATDADAGVVLVAPMRDPAAVVGAVVAAYPHRPRSLAHHEQILAGIAAHAVVALESARLHEAARREIVARQAALEARDHVARVLQQSLLLAELPVIPCSTSPPATCHWPTTSAATSTTPSRSVVATGRSSSVTSRARDPRRRPSPPSPGTRSAPPSAATPTPARRSAC